MPLAGCAARSMPTLHRWYRLHSATRLILGARDFSPGHEMTPRCLRKLERIEATEITQQFFWPTRAKQAASGQRIEMTRKTVPRVSGSASKTTLVRLHMPRALEIVDVTVHQLERGETTAIEAIDSLLPTRAMSAAHRLRTYPNNISAHDSCPNQLQPTPILVDKGPRQSYRRGKLGTKSWIPSPDAGVLSL
jgi:hypothetical protein